MEQCFGRINKLEIGDKIVIIDLYNHTVTYEVFDRYITDPNNVNILQSQNDKTKEITLITCINGNKNRLIVKAKEV